MMNCALLIFQGSPDLPISCLNETESMCTEDDGTDQEPGELQQRGWVARALARGCHCRVRIAAEHDEESDR